MSRKPRKGTSEVFYDTFADFPLEEQAIAIRMTEIHRQAVKAQKWIKIKNIAEKELSSGESATETIIQAKMDHDDGIPF